MTSWMRVKAFANGAHHQLPPTIWVLGTKKLLALLFAVVLSNCGMKEATQISVTGIVYNYTDQAVAAVRINGQNVSAIMDAVQPGGVSGGSGACCAQIAEGATEAHVEVDFGDTTYTTQAKIEKWWPDLAHYAVVHVLPGKRVVIELRSVDTWPRRDLLEQQLKQLGLQQKVIFSGPMNLGPMARADGVQ